MANTGGSNYESVANIGSTQTLYVQVQSPNHWQERRGSMQPVADSVHHSALGPIHNDTMAPVGLLQELQTQPPTVAGSRKVVGS